MEFVEDTHHKNDHISVIANILPSRVSWTNFRSFFVVISKLNQLIVNLGLPLILIFYIIYDKA